MNRNILVVGKFYNYTISRLKIFNDEFNDYVDKYYKHKIVLKNGITIEAITIDSKKINSRNYTQINADYFLELCYRTAYLENKSRLNKIKDYIKSNEWASDYEKSSCRTHLLQLLEEIK